MIQKEKGEDNTLMNSKCSQSTVESHSQLYRAVVKNLKDNKCAQHQENYSYFYNNQLLCPECFSEVILRKNHPLSSSLRKKYQYFYHLETIMNHPIILVIDESELFNHPLQLMELVLNSYKQLYHKKSDFKVQKQCIESFIFRLKARIDQLCHEILANFTSMEQHTERQVELKDELKNLSMMYEDHLMEMLGENFISGSKSQLQNILEEYARSNENPLQKIMDNLDEFMTTVSSAPILNLEHLEKIFTTITDQKLWNPLKIASNTNNEQQKSSTADMLVGLDNLSLQGCYTLKVDEEEIFLEQNEKIIGKLQLQLDSVYSLENYRLLGVNYNKLIIINYFDQLLIEDEYCITGCTDVLPFQDHLIVVSNEELIKIDRGTKKYEILGKNYNRLQYNSKGNGFNCLNQYNQKVVWIPETHYWPNSQLK